MAKELVALGMSGGMDSSVAAYLLKEEYEVIGVTLKLYGGETDRDNPCCSLEGSLQAQRVARRLHIRHYTLNLEDLFQEKVLSPFFSDYSSGKTPIPCYRCNQFLKFDAFLQAARKMGASRIATGHYARRQVHPKTGRVELWRPRDRAKDQTYFLAGLTQDQLRGALFPLENWTKDEVRKAACQLDSSYAQKGESQDLCFVGKEGTRKFLEAHLPRTPGPIFDLQGRRVGEHRGIAFYTVGQRKGLGIASKRPLYVVDIRFQENALLVGEEKDLRQTTFTVSEINWIPFDTIAPRRCTVQVRYRQSPVPVEIVEEGGTVVCRTLSPLRAITKGQAAVFYDGDRVLGGGIIARVMSDEKDRSLGVCGV